MCATLQILAKLTRLHLKKLSYSTITLLALFLMGCSADEKLPLRDYYIPRIEADSVVIHYEALVPVGFPDEKWVMRLDADGGSGPVLTTQTYDINGRLAQVSQEEFTQVGSVSRSLVIHTYDSSGHQKTASAEILDANVFPFFYPDSGDFYRHKFKWIDPRDSLEYTLEKERYYACDTTFNYKGRDHDAIVFDLIEELETFWEHDGMTQSEWTGREIYAKGLGLVYYHKKISPTLQKTYRLRNGD